MKDTGQQIGRDRLAEAMAASAVSHANGSSGASLQTSQQGRGNGEASDARESRDMGRNTVQEKTREFFQMCDVENKGFITRRDMQRLNGGLPLSAEELDNVFETLDSDGNGFLTLHEFSSGFSDFLFGQDICGEKGSNMKEAPTCKTPAEVLHQAQWEDELRQPDEDEEEEHFSMLMESLGANSVFENPAEVRNLWAQLRRDEPHLLSNFEDFLARVTAQIIEANQEKKEIESALKRKAATHDDEIQHLYEEMEQQIKNEKDRIVLQDHERFLSRCQEMELQLLGKEKEMEELFQKQRRLEQQYQELHSEQHVTKVENVKLKQDNDELARELDHTSQELTLAQDQLVILQEQSTRLHEEKEMEIYRLTEGLQRERASLLKQLDLLREMNKNLRDESDMYFQMPKKTPDLTQSPSTGTPQRSDTQVLTSDEEEQTVGSKRSSQSTRIARKKAHLPRIISIEEDHLPHLLQDYQLAQSPIQECSETPSSPRARPVGKETGVAVSMPTQKDKSAPFLPDRLFKVILVGNSGVGKTSFLRRFCDDSFPPGVSATVGIDYSVKTVTVDGSQVALQLWDTAGQERYRSVTKQFFRKVDGVIVMYDITAEQSFTAVRQWLTSIKESTGEDIPIMLLGNKTDKHLERRVPYETGQRLAKESQMAFFECSAYSGCNVMESMVHLARILKEQEDKVKEKTVQLVDSPAEEKKSCC